MVSRNSLYIVVVMLMLLLTAACDRQPSVDVLRQEISNTLEQDFRANLFELVSVRRLGSVPYRDPDTGDQRLTIYFNVQLRFLEAFDLTQWDSLNGASLAFLFGATEKGIGGIKPGGNNKDDILRIHGSRDYALRHGTWRALPITHRKEPAGEQAQETERLIERITELSKETAGRLGGTEQAIIDKELNQSITRIEVALNRQAKIFSAASASPGGAYYRYIQTLQNNAKSLGFRVHNYPTQGSVENCLLIQSGRVDIAIAQSNITDLAFKGVDIFKKHGALANIRAVTALFPEYIQIVVANNANIKVLDDLKGKRIDLGLRESGTRKDALRVLDAAGLVLPDFTEIRESNLDTAAAALQAGEIDAFFTTLQAPGLTLQELMASGKATLLSIPEPVLSTMLERHGVYRRAELPAHSYPKLNQAVQTLSVTATLIVHSDLADAKVEQLLDGLFRSIPMITRHNLRISLLSTSTARQGLTIPLHPAAQRYFDSVNDKQ